MRLKSTLEQWVTLREIERAGSIQAAAVVLNKSHTTLIYSVKKLEEQLSVQLVEVKGKRATLTEHGQSLLRRANSMLDQAKELEELSQQMAAGVESEIIVAMDHLCDPSLLYRPMAYYLRQNSATSIQVVETSLSKTSDMVTSAQADIAIITLPVTNYPAQAFSLTSMVPVVSTEHPLAQQTSLTMADFATHCQIVIRDLGASQTNEQAQNVGWLKSNQRITVDNFDHAFRAVEQGVGFCRLPTHIIAKRNQGQLQVLNVEESDCYQVPLHLTLPKGAKTGPVARCFYELLRNGACSESGEKSQ
ncbi:LysR family transcriptional regulator [Vibrio sp. T11.5]|uniref:LysR family transcriptional regulator n=1 Tax=Vibrio sp. T11.5 TaxID=2998836 RepID=UPI0022CD2FDE|nr:LysR family transcriptional regulator [Vibrio sp. T11.5]MDA0117447.1 LysR family transcriptional regulator [Vibrio sp. T11.5]